MFLNEIYVNEKWHICELQACETVYRMLADRGIVTPWKNGEVCMGLYTHTFIGFLHSVAHVDG